MTHLQLQIRERIALVTLHNPPLCVLTPQTGGFWREEGNMMGLELGRCRKTIA
jgi:hypothetical protein